MATVSSFTSYEVKIFKIRWIRYSTLIITRISNNFINILIILATLANSENINIVYFTYNKY